MNDRQRLEAIVGVVCKYLPPGGTPIKEAMSQIIALVDPLPEPVQEPKFAPYWAVTDMEGKHIKVNADTQRLEIYEEKCWARANVRSNTKAMLVYITRTTPPAQPEPDMYWDDDDSERPASDSIPELLYERWNNGDLAVGYEVSMTCAKQMEPLTVRVTEINEDTYDIEYEVVKKGGA
jgi:hypothetical protein